MIRILAEVMTIAMGGFAPKAQTRSDRYAVKP